MSILADLDKKRKEQEEEDELILKLIKGPEPEKNQFKEKKRSSLFGIEYKETLPEETPAKAVVDPDKEKKLTNEELAKGAFKTEREAKKGIEKIKQKEVEDVVAKPGLFGPKIVGKKSGKTLWSQEKGAADIASGLTSAVSGVVKEVGYLIENNPFVQPAKLASKMAGLPQADKGKVKELTDIGASKIQELASELSKTGLPDGVLKEVLKGLGSAAVEVPKLALTADGLGAWNLAAHGFLNKMAETGNIMQGAKGAGLGLLNQAAMNKIGMVFNKVFPKTPVGQEIGARLGAGAGMASGTALGGVIEGAPVSREELIGSGITGALLPTGRRSSMEQGGLPGGLKYDPSRTYYELISKTEPMEALGKVLKNAGVEVKPGRDPEYQTRSMLRTGQKIEAAIQNGFYVIDGNGKMIELGEGYAPALKRIHKQMDEVGVKGIELQKGILDKYIDARRVSIDLAKQGKATQEKIIKAKVNLLDLETTYPQLKPVFEEVTKTFKRISNNMLDILVESEKISPDYAAKLREENPNYIPFDKILEEGGYGKKGSPSGLKRMGFLSDEYYAPTESYIEHIGMAIKAAETNKTKRFIIEAAKNFEGEVELVRKDPTKPLTREEIDVNEYGKKHVYKLKNPLLKESIDKLSTGESNVVFKIMGIPAKVLKEGVTRDPVFATFNFLKDGISAFVQSGSFIPFLDQGIASYHMFKKTPTYFEFLASGGSMSGFRGTDRGILKGDVQKMMGSKKHLLKYLIPGYNVYEMFGNFSTALENATRMGVFIAGKRADMTAMQAGFAAAESTVDFGRTGASMKNVNQITAFLNPAIQGQDRMLRAFKKDPASTAIKAITAITIPYLAMHILNQGDTEMDELGDKFNMLYSPVPRSLTPGLGKQFLVVPKPQGALGAIFAYGAEKMYDTLFKKDPIKASELGGMVLNAFSPVGENYINIMPTIFKVGAELAADKNLYWKQPITPYGKELMEKPEQYKSTTPEVLKYASKQIDKLVGGGMEKLVGKRLGVSPEEMNYLSSNLFGSMGSNVVKLADMIWGKKLAEESGKKYTPPKEASKWPFISRFLKPDPLIFPASLDRFQEMRKKVEGIQRSLNLKKAERDLERVKELSERPELKYRDFINTTSGTLQEIDKAIRDTEQSSLPDKEKAKQLTSLYEQRVALLKSVFDITGDEFD